MSFVFLECVDFAKLFPTFDTNQCCENCHKGARNADKIYVTPFKEDGWNTDWQLCVQAVVCCKQFDFVRALPREFWVRQAQIHGVGRDDSRGYIYPSSPERNTERSRTNGTGVVGSRSSTRATSKPRVNLQSIREQEEAGGLAGWRK